MNARGFLEEFPGLHLFLVSWTGSDKYKQSHDDNLPDRRNFMEECEFLSRQSIDQHLRYALHPGTC